MLNSAQKPTAPINVYSARCIHVIHAVNLSFLVHAHLLTSCHIFKRKFLSFKTVVWFWIVHHVTYKNSIQASLQE